MALYKNEKTALEDLIEFVDTIEDDMIKGIMKYHIEWLRKEIEYKDKQIEAYKGFFNRLNNFLPDKNSNPVF